MVTSEVLEPPGGVGGVVVVEVDTGRRTKNAWQAASVHIVRWHVLWFILATLGRQQPRGPAILYRDRLEGVTFVKEVRDGNTWRRVRTVAGWRLRSTCTTMRAHGVRAYCPSFP